MGTTILHGRGIRWLALSMKFGSSVSKIATFFDCNFSFSSVIRRSLASCEVT